MHCDYPDHTLIVRPANWLLVVYVACGVLAMALPATPMVSTPLAAASGLPFIALCAVLTQWSTLASTPQLRIDAHGMTLYGTRPPRFLPWGTFRHLYVAPPRLWLPYGSLHGPGAALLARPHDAQRSATLLASLCIGPAELARAIAHWTPGAPPIELMRRHPLA